MIETRQEAAVTLAAKSAVYGLAGSTVFFGLTANELAAIGGLILGLVALVVNTAISIYYKSEHLKLAKKRAKEQCEIPEDDGDQE